MNRLFAALTAGILLAPTPALAGGDCDHDRFEYPGVKAEKLADWKAVFRALRPDTPVPASDDAIGEALCWQAGCQSAIPLMTDVDGMASLVVAAPDGGLWLVRDLDFADFGQCSRGDFTLTPVGGELVLVHLDIGWGERTYCEDLPEDEQADCPGNSCAFAGEEYHDWVFDKKAGVLLTKATCGEMLSSDDPDMIPAPKVGYDRGVYSYRGCGRDISASVDDLRRCAGARATKDGGKAMKLVNEGRKLTKAKKYGDAITTFDKALDLDANEARAWSGRGYAKLLSDDLAGAQADFQRALDLNHDKPFQSAIWYNLGVLAEKKKDDMAAVLAFARAHELKPSAAVEKKLKQYQKATKRKLKQVEAPKKRR
ncbi:MAG: tetratricopeptide repeat protein [Deltaproteobacteria bacterium]|nr:MAG: tetratricopeptide repeat protein [Deltaproteobacteria bacterium]